jgi:hypothetical protein
MKVLLAAVARRLLGAFVVALIFYIPGILAAPNVEAAVALSISALLASLAALLKLVQELVPAFSWSALGVSQPLAAWLDAFTQVAIPTFIVAITGWLLQPDFSTWRSVALAALLGAGMAGFRALEGLFTKGEQPAPGTP